MRTTLDRMMKHVDEQITLYSEHKKMCLELKNNPLLVFIEETERQELTHSMLSGLFEKNTVHRSMSRWCFDNNIQCIIEKYELDVIDSSTFEKIAFWARRFKTAEDAAAFKLRWNNVTEKDIYDDNEEESSGIFDDDIPF